MNEEGTGASPLSSPHINTYHCICSTLILATTHSLPSLPTRASPAQDQAIILQLPSQSSTQSSRSHGHSVLYNAAEDRKPIIVRREDGFEKRSLVRCGRCNLVFGYKLDESHFVGSDVKADELMYLLPGGLVVTEEMKAGKFADAPTWAKEAL